MLIDEDGLGINLTVCFNPKDLKVSKKVAWTKEEGAENDEPNQVFGKPDPSTLAVTLQFDTYEEGVSVYAKYVHAIEQLTMIISDSKRRPPVCRLVWGSFTFKGVITSLDQTYTMFLANGTPVRCDCSISMTKASGASAADEKKGKGQGGKAPFKASDPLWR